MERTNNPRYGTFCFTTTAQNLLKPINFNILNDFIKIEKIYL